MNMPKSRDMQVKIPSPKAIFHFIGKTAVGGLLNKKTRT